MALRLRPTPTLPISIGAQFRSLSRTDAVSYVYSITEAVLTKWVQFSEFSGEFDIAVILLVMKTGLNGTT